MATAEIYSSDGRHNAEEIMHKLLELFGNEFEFDVIYSMARKCNYDIELTSNELLEQLERASNVRNQDAVIGFTDVNCSNNSDYVMVPQMNYKTKNEKSLYSQIAGIKQNSKDDVVIESETEIYNTPPGRSSLNSLYNTQGRSKSKSKKEREFERIIEHVRKGTRILILLRGLPGSGKSTLARQIIDRTVTLNYGDYCTYILSTDDYFFDKRSGRYKYDPCKLQEAHEFNQQRAYNQMAKGVSPIIIDNTNSQMWEMKSYAMIAANFGYIIEILEPFTPWAFDEKQLALKNSHSVPRAKIQAMLLRYEKHITPADLFGTYKLSYLNQCPPVLRDFPPLYHNLQHVDQSSKNKEQSESNTMDLIGFDEKLHSQTAIYITDDSSDENDYCTKLRTSSLMDSNVIDSNVNNAKILQPTVASFQSLCNLNPSFKESKIADMNSNGANQVNNEKVVQQINNAKAIYPSLNLASWGLPENAVSSWEYWDVVSPLNDSKNVQNSFEVDEKLESPNILETSSSATNTLSSDFKLLTTESITPNEQIKILRATSRDINKGAVIVHCSSPPKKMLLDKSSMTNEDTSLDETNENETEQLNNLISLFPNIPFDYIQDIYDKCHKNINWAVDLLLDDSKEILPHLRTKVLSGSPKKIVSFQNDKETYSKHSDTISSSSSENAEIERLIKESIHINKELYSDHVMKIKNLKEKSGGNSNNARKMELPSSSSSSCCDVTSTYPEVTTINSSADVNNFELDITSSLNEDVDEDQTVEINLGNVCISQLGTLFGFPQTFPKGFQPVVQIPYELAGQLHAFYIQSVLLQMEAQNSILDMIVKEDEELAKKLQMQEDLFEDDDNGRKTPDLNEIMKDEVANKHYRREIESWKKLTPDTLAAKLTIQKLVNSFPSVSKVLLMEILHAHNNSYEQTVEVLLASTDSSSIHDPEHNIMEPPIPESVLTEMKQANQEKLATENIEDVAKTANEYRDEANDYHRKHNECMQKAQHAFQSKQYAVALFYSDIAKSYTKLYEQTNGMAATAFLEEHSTRLQDFHTLDLHYLYVKEALPALDIFLDRNINLLKGTNKKKKSLFIITGRGKRSQGKSKLKPAIINHLRKRDIKYSLLNPGLLKATVHPNSLLTHNV